MKRKIISLIRRIRCGILHRSQWRRWVKFIGGAKVRFYRCMKCNEEWNPHPMKEKDIAQVVEW